MSRNSIKSLLLVEDNPGDARLIREMLNERGSHNTELTHVQCMSEAEKHLAEHPVNVILLDLDLPDAQGPEAIRRAQAAAPRVPLAVLTVSDDESLAAQAVQEGPQAPLILGRHVLPYFEGRPGTHIGEVARAAYEAQADGEFSTEAEALQWLERHMKERPA